MSQSIWRDARKVSLFKHLHVKFQPEMMYRLHSVIVWSTQFSSCHKNETKRILCSSHGLDSNLGTGKNCTGLNPEKKMNEESIRSPIRVNCTEIVFFFHFWQLLNRLLETTANVIRVTSGRNLVWLIELFQLYTSLNRLWYYFIEIY